MAETTTAGKPSPQVPRIVVRSIWIVHRAAYRLTGGRFGLRTATEARWGMLRLRTSGRRTGKERIAILGFIEDGPNIVTPAMNGWADPEPAWWLNLQANPTATIELPDGTTRPRDREASDGGGARPPVACPRRPRDGRLHGRERRPSHARDCDRGPRAAEQLSSATVRSRTEFESPGKRARSRPGGDAGPRHDRRRNSA